MTLHPQSSMEDTKRYRNIVTRASVQNGLFQFPKHKRKLQKIWKRNVRIFETSNQSQLFNIWDDKLHTALASGEC